MHNSRSTQLRCSFWGNDNLVNFYQILPDETDSDFNNEDNPKLPADLLLVKCEMRYQDTFSKTSGCLPSISPATGTGSCVDRFDLLKQLFQSKSQSDIIIHVNEKKFKAHKLILSTRSPVFLAMFEKNHTEKKTNTLKIEGIEPTVFAEVLRFIYTDEVENLDELAAELLAAAERYMLDLIKAKCEESLAGNITTENCAELLLLADLHSANGLKKFVLDFIRLRAGLVFATTNWQEFMKSTRPQLLRDILNLPSVSD